MKKNLLLLIFFLLSFKVFAFDDFRRIYPNFDASLFRYGRSYPYWDRYFIHVDRANPPLHYLRKCVFEAFYNRDKARFSQEGNEYKIPRIIHQIWLGSSFPKKYEKWASSWKNWDGWEYKLWTEKEINELVLHNADLYKSAPNYGERSDILRYEILNQFGGLYVDTDMQCVNKDFFEFAHKQYSFFIGIEPLECCPFSCGNAIMASAPHHPMIEQIVKGLAAHAENHRHEWTVEKTGPRYITKAVYENLPFLVDNGMVFPPTFFYPITGFEWHRVRLYCKHETAAIHFFEGSWTR